MVTELALLMPHKIVFTRRSDGAWRESTGGGLYRRLQEGAVYQLIATSHTDASLAIHLSSAMNASTRIASDLISGRQKNMHLREVPVIGGQNRFLSIIGGGVEGDQLTIGVIPMLID